MSSGEEYPETHELYILATGFKAKFFIYEDMKQSDLDHLKSDVGERLCERFSLYVLERVPEEKGKAMELDPNFWYNVLFGI